MQRRTFINIIGGGVVLAATGAVATTQLRSAFPAAAIADWAGPAASETDVRRWALGYAILAPNPHNLQPWIVDLSQANTITLYYDRTRMLPHTDPLGRQVLIGHGCFLELLALALAERGMACDITLFPNGEFGAALTDFDTRPVARITLRAGASKDPLFAQILHRHTPKAAFDTTRAVAPETLTQLQTALPTPSSGMQFGAVREPAQVEVLRKLAMDAARVEFETERTMMESIRLIRIGPDEITRHRDGISINSAFVRFASTVGLFNRTEFPQPGSTGHKQAIERYAVSTRTAAAFVWLATSGNTRGTQVNAGRAYARMQLAATAAGVGMHPLSQALQEFAEMRPHYEAVHRALLGKVPDAPTDSTLQMLCRVGYAAEVGPTPRRGVAAIIRA